MLQILLLIIGFFLLIRGAEWLISGASEFAKRVGVNELLVGLTVVAFGTSLPELIVNIFATTESTGLAIGNVLGSNIANILLVLGVAAIIRPLTVHRLTVNREVVFNIMASVVLLLLAADHWLIEEQLFEGLSRTDGIVLITYFVVFLYYAFGKNSFASSEPKPLVVDTKTIRLIPLMTFKVIVGALALFLGGRWIVDGALYLSSLMNLSDEVVGLTIVALGTSLPELAASITAVRKGSVDLAVGNAVGSNLFNILWVLGISAFIRPLGFDEVAIVDVLAVVAVSLVLFTTVAVGEFKHQISRFEGKLFIALYLVYIVFVTLR